MGCLTSLAMMCHGVELWEGGLESCCATGAVLSSEQYSEGGMSLLVSDPVLSLQCEWHLRSRAAESVPESD